MVRGE